MKLWSSRMAIPYTRVPRSSRLLLDYLYDFDRVAEFFTASPFGLAGYQTVASQLPAQKGERGKLADVLAKQNQSFGGFPAVFNNIERLRHKETFAVVTGQQVGLFSGPVYTLYKALTAVRLAQWLSEQGLPSVPVFWLATEDHDLEEVSQAAVLDDEYARVTVSDPGERPSPKSPVGLTKLTAGVTETMNRLEAVLPIGDNRASLMQDLRACYQPGQTWTQGFGRLMARFFGRWGVILVDAFDPILRELSAKTCSLAVERSADLRGKLLDRSRKLEESSYHAQVHVAADSTLLFLLEGSDRLVLRQSSDGFTRENGARYSAAELKSLAANGHSRFSSNVLMRPIVQDALLPTLAYVAGPSELAYLGQAQAIYADFGRPMPVVFPRAAFTLLDPRTERLLEKYKISVEDVWQGEEHLNGKIALAGLADGWGERFDQSERELTTLLERSRKDIESLDPTLLDSLKNAEEKMKYQLERVRGKLSRAALQRSELLRRHQQAVRRLLFPEKDLQERQVCGVYFLARASYALLDRILNEIRVESSDHQVFLY